MFKITVNGLMEELKEIIEKGYGDCVVFVPSESGLTGAFICKGWYLEHDIVILISDDM